MNDSRLNSALKEFKKITGMDFDTGTIRTDDLEFTISQLLTICNSYKEKHNVTYFLRNVILGKVPSHNVCKDASSFHISQDVPRALLLLETKTHLDDSILTVLDYIFSDQEDVHIIPVSDHHTVILHPYKVENSFREQVLSLCHVIADTINTELLIPVKISCGTPCKDLLKLSSSYEQALTALNIGKRFHLEQTIFFYDELGIDRLVYYLPEHVCTDFLNEVWKKQIPSELDSELTSLINCFLQNNLNIAETARQLHMHRNTLIYRIEKIESQTNLDIRNFEDAMTLKLALMIMNNRK